MALGQLRPKPADEDDELSALLREADALISGAAGQPQPDDDLDSLLREADALISGAATAPKPVSPRVARAQESVGLAPMTPAVSHRRPTLEDTFGLRPMASHATGPSFNDLNNKTGRAAGMKAGRPALPAAQAPSPAGPAPMTFGASVGRGVDVAQQLGLSAVEAVGEAVGSEGLTSFGAEGRRANQSEIDAAGPRSSFFDISGPGDFLQWAKETIGEQIPIMAPGLAGAAVGGVVGGPIGAAIGAFVPSLAMGVGEVAGAIKERDETASSPAATFIGGSAIAALDSVLPGKIGARLARTFGVELAEQVAARTLTRPVTDTMLRVGRGGAQGMAIEGLTESLQEAIGEVATSRGTGTPIDPALLTRMGEAGAAGALLGAVGGGAAEIRPEAALAGHGGGPAPMRPVPSHEPAKPQPPVEPKPIITPPGEPFLDQTPTPADLAVEELAAVRGTPAQGDVDLDALLAEADAIIDGSDLANQRVADAARLRGTTADVPNNPVARQLEAERTAPPAAADETAETGRLAAATALLEMEPEGSDARTGTESDRATPSRSRATSPPAFGDAPTSQTAGEFYTMPPDAIAVDPSRFQFKAGGNTAGVTAAAKIDGPWNEARAGVLMVWKDPADGQTYVVNGHHRLEAAKRLGAERVAVRYVEAPDAATARVEGALTNISEDKGTPLDAAKLIRDAGFEQSDLVEAGLSPKSALLRDGLGLAALSDPLFARVVAGEIDEKTGGAIGSAGLSPEGQAAVATLVERQQAKGRTLTSAQVRVLAEDVASTPEVKADDGGQASIFDLMGEERTQNVAVEKAVLRDWARQQLAQDKRLFGFVAKDGRADALARGGNRIDVNQSKAIADEAGQVAAVFDRLAGSAGPVSRALNAAAVRMAEGRPSHEVRTGLLADLRTAVAAELGRPAPQADGGAKGPGGRVGQEARPERRAADPQPGIEPKSSVADTRPLADGTIRAAEDDRSPRNDVQFGMAGRRLDREVLASVVRSIPISVVDVLGGEQRATDLLLHDHAVLADALASSGGGDVPGAIARTREVVATSRAKLRGARPGTPDAKDLAALEAFDRLLVERAAALTSGKNLPAVGDNLRLASADLGAETSASDVTRRAVSAEFTRDGKAIIRGLAAADVSTGIHEIAHVARRQLLNRHVPADERHGITDEDITTAEQWAGAVDGVWSVAAEEKLARGFERYLMDGVAPDGRLRRTFAQFRSWLSEVYQTITGSGVDVDVSPAMRGVFDRLTTRALPVKDKKPSRPTGKSDLPVTPKRPRADQVSALPVGPRRPSESPEQMSARLVKAVEADTAGYVRRYRAQFDRIVNGDNASELFPEYVADRSAHERTVRPAAAKIVNAVFAELLAEPVSADRKAIAVFTSGGNGSGKSTATSGEVAGHATFDSTLSQFDPSVAKIDQALAAGLEVRIRHTARHPVEAWTNGVLSRAMAPNHPQAGRTVSLNGHAVTHGRARETLVQLADHYADNPRVQFVVRENRPDGTMTTRSVDWLREQRYPVGDDLRAHLRTALEDARASGRISQAVYDGAAGHASRPRPDRPADGRGVQEEPRPRPQPPVTPKVKPSSARGPLGMPRNSQISTIPPAPAGKPAPPVTPRMRPSDIVAQLREALGRLPIRDRNVRGANQGQYHPDVREIRVRVANELPVIFHEAGHDLDLAILKIGRKDARWRDELVALGQRTSRPSYKAWQVRQEGAAEFFRLYLMDEAAAKAQAPNYFAEFERRLDEHRDLKRLLHATRENFRGYASQDLPTRLKARIDFEGQGTTTGLKKAATDTKGWMRDQAVAWVDDLQVLKEAVTDLRDGRPLDDRHNAYTLARIARGAAGKAQAFLEYGVRGRGGQFISGSLADALKPVKTALEDFTAYLVALRTIELKGRGIETGISQAEAVATVKAARARADYAAFEQARDAVYAYQDATIEYARQYGALSKEQIAKMRLLNQAYVPFKRVMDDVEASWGGVSRKLANRSVPIRRIKGSGRDIINPLESIVTNTHALVDMVEKNRAMLALTNQANQAPASARWLVKIPPPQVPNTVNVLEVLEGVAGRDPAIADFLAATGVTEQDAVTLFSPAFMAPQGKNIVTVIRDGQREFYQVNDQELYDAITRIGPNLKDSVLAAMFEPFTRLLRAGATLTPEFIARNPGRDTLVAYLQSRYGFIPGLDTARGLVGLIRNDADAKLFYTSGIDQAALTGQDRDRIRQNLQGLTRQGKYQVAKYLVTHPLELLRAVSGQMEAATRLGEFKLALEAAGVERGILGRLFGGSSRTVTEETVTRATLAARDVTTDFSRGGQKARELNRYTAFFNARVQGYVRMVETVKRDPVGTLEHLAALGAFTAALWFLNRDDEQYEELAEWEKRTYWHLKIPFTPAGTPFIRIPKPFEWAYIPDVIEAALDFTVKQDPNAWRLVRPSQSSLAQLVVSLVPTAILPLLEAYTNYSTFRERPIVRPFDLNLPVEQQYSDFTSETAKRLSRVIPVAPAKLDHVLFGYTAGLGRLAIGRVDELGSSLGLLPAQKSRPAKTFEQLPVIGVFGRSRNFAGSAASIDQFYDDYNAMTGHLQGLDRAEEAQDAEQIARFNASANRAGWLEREDDLKEGYKELRDLGKEIDAIYDAPADKMTPAQKREALDRVRARMVDIARRALGKPGLTSQ